MALRLAELMVALRVGLKVASTAQHSAEMMAEKWAAVRATPLARRSVANWDKWWVVTMAAASEYKMAGWWVNCLGVQSAEG